MYVFVTKKVKRQCMKEPTVFCVFVFQNRPPNKLNESEIFDNSETLYRTGPLSKFGSCGSVYSNVNNKKIQFVANCLTYFTWMKLTI